MKVNLFKAVCLICFVCRKMVYLYLSQKFCFKIWSDSIYVCKSYLLVKLFWHGPTIIIKTYSMKVGIRERSSEDNNREFYSMATIYLAPVIFLDYTSSHFRLKSHEHGLAITYFATTSPLTSISLDFQHAWI